jgi:hypothetical protein
MSMIRKLTAAIFVVGMLPLSCYAADECDNANPYIQQTCAQLKQSASTEQKARDAQREKEIAKQEEIVRRRIQEENKPPKSPEPVLPKWQEALKPPAPKSSEEAHPASPPVQEEPVVITPLPPMTPTEFSPPKAKTLPGGVNMIPIKPEKNSRPGVIKYY